MLCVKNDVVKMDWNVEGYLENKYVGFICAIHEYHGVVVVFDESGAYTMVQDGTPMKMKEIVKLIKDSYNINKKTGEVDREYVMDEFEEYVPLISGDDALISNLEKFDFTQEELNDMGERIDDVAPLFQEVLEDM